MVARRTIGQGPSYASHLDRGEETLEPVRSCADIPDAPIELQLIDGFSVRCGSVEMTIPLGAQRVVAFVALHPVAVTRPYVAGSLWLDVNDDRAAANLRSALWRLGSISPPMIRASRTHLGLDPNVTVDYREAAAGARQLLDPTNDVIDAELSIPPGELLPDWYEDWVTIEREQFHFLRLNALEQLCLRLADRGRLAEAVDAGMAAVAAEPLHESAHRALVRAHMAAGNWWDALRQYESYRTLIGQQLDLPPSPEMEALIRPLRQHRPGTGRTASVGGSPR